MTERDLDRAMTESMGGLVGVTTIVLSAPG
jgi:hypothetical protein